MHDRRLLLRVAAKLLIIAGAIGFVLILLGTISPSKDALDLRRPGTVQTSPSP